MQKSKSTKNKQSFLVKLGDFITEHRFFFLILFLGMSVFCCFNVANVEINDSIISYLPDETETKQGMNIMEEEFGDLTTIKLMIKDISLEEAKQLATELSSLQNVKSVVFDETESAYKDNHALYTLELEDVSEDEIDQAKNDIEALANDAEYSIYSEAFEDTMDGIDLALALSVGVIVIILLITSKTYFEPVIAFVIFAISIILNMGSNFIFGEISYITQSIAVILQLALSIDYVIIFMNQFMKEIGDTDDKLLAIKKTVTKTTPEIFASSLTTVAGLLALIFMQLKIGEDIGLVLSKGIICSLLTVIFVMPSLLSLFTKVILKLKKKEKVRKSNELCEFILKARKALLASFVVLVAIAIAFIPSYRYVYNPTSAQAIRVSKNTQALNDIEAEFGASNDLVILAKNEQKDYAKELELANKLQENPQITAVTSLGSYEIIDGVSLGSKVNYLELAKVLKIDDKLSLNLFQYYAKQHNQLAKLADPKSYRVSIIDLVDFLHDNLQKLPVDNALKTQFDSVYETLDHSRSLLESNQYSRFLLNLDTPVESVETYEMISDIREVSGEYYEDVKLIGNSVNAMDLEHSFTSDNIVITAITIFFIAIILLVTFKSIWLTALLILTIEGSILINFGIVALLGKEIFFMAYIVVSAIQMGATIDYSIVIATRYKALREKYDKKKSIIGTLEDSIPAVVTSGLILLVAGFLIGFISPSSVISSIGLFLGIGTVISLVAAIFVLPAILYLFDKFFVKARS